MNDKYLSRKRLKGAPPSGQKGAEKILHGLGTSISAKHYPNVTAETPLPSKRQVIRSRKASAPTERRPFFLRAPFSWVEGGQAMRRLYRLA